MTLVIKAGTSTTSSVSLASFTSALIPQTLTSLFSISLVTKPEPDILTSFPPANELETADAVGVLFTLIETVGGETKAYPYLSLWGLTRYFPVAKYPFDGLMVAWVLLMLVMVIGYTVEVGLELELRKTN